MILSHVLGLGKKPAIAGQLFCTSLSAHTHVPCGTFLRNSGNNMLKDKGKR